MVQRRSSTTEGRLELLPVMNMVTILIPLLLLSAQFVNLAVIDSTVPAITDRLDPERASAESLDLTVVITGQGFALRTRMGPLDAAARVSSEAAPAVPCVGGACVGPATYDYAELNRILSLVKDDHPDDTTIILAPDSAVPFEVVVGVMDAARAELSGERLLFPEVVIAGGVG